MSVKREKWDETDFEFEMEDMSGPKEKELVVEKGRVLTKPRRYRNVAIGIKQTKAYEICLHGKFKAEKCGSCEFEAPRIEGDRAINRGEE